ncbi:hypothetical protein RND81_11G124100 [Saponaria officinalis]|uniref:Centromere protein C n=1 Tax=Saponaria officinalis TaxID=3572 RepID=A0AAW1HL94_SAPOF
MVYADGVDSLAFVDPLVDYSPFSFNLSSSFPPLPNPNHDSLLSHLKNLVLRNPDSIVNQGKTIKDGGMDVLENDKTVVVASEDQNERPLTGSDKNPQERRPDLGLKRAKFKVKPMPSQPDTNLEPSIDIDNLSDPEEFFEAFERMENAKKEMRRLKGQPLVDIDQNRSSLHPRGQRPSLLRKSATYKHHSYSSTGVPDKDDALLSSQEADYHRIMSPTREDVMPEIDAMKDSAEIRVSDVKSAMGSKVSELDELLSCNYDVLDEDGVQTLLQDKLNLKPVDIEKLFLPEMPDVRSRVALPKTTDSIYHLHDSVNPASSKPLNFKYQFKKSSPSNLASPSLPKSPLASISSLNKHISIFSPSKDPFSPLDIDSSQGVTRNKQVEQIGKKTDSHDFSRFFANGEESSMAITSPSRFARNTVIPNMESREQLDEAGHSHVNVTSKDSHEIEKSPACREENIAVSEMVPSPIAKESTPIDDPEECLKSPTNGEEDYPVSGEASLASATKDVDSTIALSEQEDQIAADPKPAGKESLSEGSAVEKASVNGEQQANKGRKGKGKSNAPVQKEPKNKKRKVEVASPLPRKVNEQSRRNSLYAAGTKWEAGLRRSTRIRMRPLEFWRGERFLYGRVHKSMVSVIGVKYTSPTKDAEGPAVKVKSFVSDEYKNLLDLASSY